MIKFFTRIFFCFIFLFCSSTKGQTWVSTKYFDNSSGTLIHNDTTPIGPLEMCKLSGGGIVTITRIDPDVKNNLVFLTDSGIGSAGATISHSFGSSSESAYGLLPTYDNGYVYEMQHLNSAGSFVKINKIGSTGLFSETTYYPNYLSHITPTPLNTNYVFNSHDSILEYDSNGNFMRGRSPASGYIVRTMNDSDFIMFNSTSISRQDFNGVIKWLVHFGNCFPISVDTNVIYCKLGNQVLKLKTIDGSTIWTKTISHFGISKTYDDGLITCGGIDKNLIAKYDSTGNLILSRSIPFPQFGYRNIIELSPNYFITGGAYKCNHPNNWGSGYSYFYMSLDSSLHGVIDSTHQYYTGNANDNNILSFADDAATIAAAIGNTGLTREPALKNLISASVFGTNWQGRFCTGLNYKYSDYNGDGTIDTTDIINLAYNNYGPNSVSAHWPVSAPQNSIPSIKLIIAEDSIIAGDSITIYITVGSDSFPVDSIYALSITILSQYIGDFTNCNFSIPTNNFGDTSLNLYFYYLTTNVGQFVNILYARTDHINTFLQGDTIAKFRWKTFSHISGNRTPQFWFSAVTNCGYQLNLNLISDNIYLNNPSLGISKINDSKIVVSPNPSPGLFYIDINNSLDGEVLLFNSIGKEILRREINESRIFLDLENQPEGIYYLQCKTSNDVFHSKILIVH